MHIHEAGRIYGSPWLETGTHRFPRAHPCSFDAPRARIARLEALKCNASQRFYSAARCAEVRSWPQVVENDERLIDARPKSREGKVATNCAAQGPREHLVNRRDLTCPRDWRARGSSMARSPPPSGRRAGFRTKSKTSMVLVFHAFCLLSLHLL